MRQFNISPDSYIEKVTAAKIEERRKDKNVIVCENGVVYNKEDSMLKQILTDLYNKRKQYKSTSYQLFEKSEYYKKLAESRSI
jgi:hypothetical protein